jgi:hypothetical protein
MTLMVPAHTQDNDTFAALQQLPILLCLDMMTVTCIEMLSENVILELLEEGCCSKRMKPQVLSPFSQRRDVPSSGIYRITS